MTRRPTVSGSILAALLGLILCAGLSACTEDGDSAPVVTIATGQVRGTATLAMKSWRGIPYAAPPVGALRWKPPVAPAVRPGISDATSYAPHCAQLASPFGQPSMSEDCLYLNVYTPITPGPHPVMVWLHGGAFYLGQS